MNRTVEEILNRTGIEAAGANCLIVVDNDVDEELQELMIAFSEPDGAGNIISLTRIAPRSIYQYTISGYCVREIGAIAFYQGETPLKFAVRNAGADQCFTKVPFGIAYGSGAKLASISSRSETEEKK